MTLYCSTNINLNTFIEDYCFIIQVKNTVPYQCIFVSLFNGQIGLMSCYWIK